MLSTLLIQNKAFSYSKNSGKVSVTVSVNNTDKSDNKSADAKTNASVSKRVETITNSSKDNTPVSKTAETPSVKDTSNEQSYSYDESSSDNNYVRNNNFGNKVNGYKSSRKYEIAKQERLFDAIKNFKNEESLDKSDLKKIDSLVNRRIKEIAKKIRFKFNKDDEKQFFEFAENTNYDIEIIEKKAELVDYVQKTFEVMGIIN